MARRRSRRAGGGKNRSGVEDATDAEGEGRQRRTLASDAWRRGACVVELLPRTQETRRRDRQHRKSERRFKQSPCCQTFIGECKDRDTTTVEVAAHELHRLHRCTPELAGMQIHRNETARRECAPRRSAAG